MRTEIDAAFIGDSHGMIVQSAADQNGIFFRLPITAASATFAHARFVENTNDQPEFIVDPERLDPERHPATKIKHREHKASLMAKSFRDLFDAPLPVFANLGTTARPFVQRFTRLQQDSGQPAYSFSRKLVKRAAQEFFTDFRAQYAEIAKYCPDITCFYGPTRFTPETRDLWLTYDDAISTELKSLGIKMMDLRGDLGDETLMLRPEYHAENPEDPVHANAAWGMAVIDAIQRNLATRDSKT